MSFEPQTFLQWRGGHTAALDIRYHAHTADWIEVALPWREDLVGEPATGVLASGPILAMMDVATSVAVWMSLGRFRPHATLDLRVDYLRPARPGATVIGRAECYRNTRAISFARGQAHDGDPDDPLAHVVATFASTEAGA